MQGFYFLAVRSVARVPFVALGYKFASGKRKPGVGGSRTMQMCSFIQYEEDPWRAACQGGSACSRSRWRLLRKWLCSP